MRVPSLSEVFRIREERELPFFKKTGPSSFGSLPHELALGVKGAMDSDGQHLPYVGEPPEGSFFFAQAPTDHNSGPFSLCLHVPGPKGGENLVWQVFEPNVNGSDEEGDYEFTDDAGNTTKGNASPNRAPRPDIAGFSGIWLKIDDSEVEQWVKSKTKRSHLRPV